MISRSVLVSHRNRFLNHRPRRLMDWLLALSFTPSHLKTNTVHTSEFLLFLFLLVFFFFQLSHTVQLETNPRMRTNIRLISFLKISVRMMRWRCPPEIPKEEGGCTVATAREPRLKLCQSPATAFATRGPRRCCWYKLPFHFLELSLLFHSFRPRIEHWALRTSNPCT